MLAFAASNCNPHHGHDLHLHVERITDSFLWRPDRLDGANLALASHSADTLAAKGSQHPLARVLAQKRSFDHVLARGPVVALA